MTPVVASYYQAPIYNNTASFQIKEELGKGDKGVVYLAEDATGQQYALKVYRSAAELIEKGFPAEIVPYYFDESGRSRLAEREYELSQILNHPAFVKVFGTTVMDGNSVLIMEYIDGSVGGQTSSSAFTMAVEGLVFALERGYKSSDLYDENCMVDLHGNFKFIDLDSFDKVEAEIEDDKIEDCLDSHRYFLRDFLDGEALKRFEEISRDYRDEIKDRLGDNISPETLSLIIEYLTRVSALVD